MVAKKLPDNGGLGRSPCMGIVSEMHLDIPVDEEGLADQEAVLADGCTSASWTAALG